MKTCYKCSKTTPKMFEEPHCSAPDCDEFVYLCQTCDDEQADQDYEYELSLMEEYDYDE